MKWIGLKRAWPRLHDPVASGWLITAIGFFGFLLWASLFEMDQGIYAQGQIVVNEGKVSITSPTNGQIVELRHQPGDQVNAGEPLIIFNPNLLAAKLSGNRDSIAGTRVAVASLQTALIARTQQIEELERQFASFTKLSEIGYSSKTYVSTLGSQLSLARSELHELSATVEQNKAKLRELESERSALEGELSRLIVRAPIDGVLMNSSVGATGINMTMGSHLLDIAPSAQSLIAKVRIPPAFATQAKVNASVDVLFPTLPGSSTLRIDGILFHVSGDQITDDRTNEAYLEGYVRFINLVDQKKLGLRAGLPTTVIIKTGKRTLISYLTRPLQERFARGMH